MDRLPEMETPRYEVLSSLKQVREMLKATERAQLVALDVQAEGTGAVGATLTGVSLCFEPGHVYHAPLGPEGTDRDAILRELRPLLGVSSAPKVMHDSKPGLVVLAQCGVEPGTPSFDTLLAAFLIDGKSYGLGDLITERLGLTAGGRNGKEGGAGSARVPAGARDAARPRTCRHGTRGRRRRYRRARGSVTPPGGEAARSREGDC